MIVKEFIIGLIFATVAAITFFWIIYTRKKKPEVKKQTNPDFIAYADSKKARELHEYLKRIKSLFNDPLTELLKQKGLLMEIRFTHKMNDSEKEAITIQIHKTDQIIERYMRDNKTVFSGQSVFVSDEEILKIKDELKFDEKHE